MKRLLILLLVAVSCSMYGQQTVTYDQLARTKWNREVNDWEGKTAYSKWFYTMEFTDSLLIYSSYGVTYDKRTNESHKSGTAIRRFLYYLSPEEPSAFDYSKVGKNSSGQYLVMHNIRFNDDNIWTSGIDQLTDSTLFEVLIGYDIDEYEHTPEELVGHEIEYFRNYHRVR